MNTDVLSLLDENVYIVDIATHEILYMNAPCMNVLGITEQDYKGKMCYRVVQGQDEPCSFCTTPFLSEDKFYEWNFYNPILDKHFHIKDKKIQFEGRTCRFEIAMDVTEIMKEKESVEYHSRSLELCIPGAVIIMDDNLKIVWYSDAFLGFLGYTREQFSSEMGNLPGYVDPVDMPLVTQKSKEARQSGELLHFPIRVFRRDGTPCFLLTSLVYRKKSDGQGIFYSMGIDITDYMQRLETKGRSLQEALEAAQKANMAKNRFLSRMSHELRTPLNGIIGMSQIALNSLENRAVVEESQRKVGNAATYLLALLNDVLDIANIEYGAFEIRPAPMRVGELLGDIISVYSQEAQACGINFSVHLEYFVEEYLSTDMVRVKQMLGNLLSNAFKFTSCDGHVSLSLRKISSEPGTVWLEFVVEDNGMGMSQEMLSKVFEPFEQEDLRSVQLNSGVGLGLPICRHIVTSLNGTLDMHSTKGEGTCCVVRLPLSLVGDWRDVLKQEHKDALAGLRVLHWDEPEAQANMRAVAAALNVRVDAVADGQQAVRSLLLAAQSNRPYSLVLMGNTVADAASTDFVQFAQLIRQGCGVEAGQCAETLACLGGKHKPGEMLGTMHVLHKPFWALSLLELLYKMGLLPSWPGFRQNMSFDFSGKRLLLVEDNAINCEVACELLSRECKFHIETADNGKVAVEMFDARPEGYYNLVLMDICMPVMDGLEATRNIRCNAAKGGHRVPIVALSANAFAEDRERSRQCGINAHMAKPLDLNALCPVLADLLNESQGHISSARYSEKCHT